jgi:hypothetical protein
VILAPRGAFNFSTCILETSFEFCDIAAMIVLLPKSLLLIQRNSR